MSDNNNPTVKSTEPTRSHSLLTMWQKEFCGKVLSPQGYTLVGKLVFNGFALVAAALTVQSLTGTWSSAERQEIQQESARLSSLLYSDKSTQRLDALRGYSVLVLKYNDKPEATQRAKFALVDYFARWRSGELSAPREQKSLELQAAWNVASVLQAKNWYGAGGGIKNLSDFSWVEVQRPRGWKGSADPRLLFKNGFFDNAELADFDLSCLDLSGAKFSGSDLSHITAYAANLTRASLINSSISNVKMRGVLSSQADFSLAKISLSDFSSIPTTEIPCRKTDSRSGRSDFMKSYFQDASLNSVNFIEVRLDTANFSNALLLGVNFSGSTGAGVVFKNTTIDRVEFSNTKLVGSDFSRAIISSSSFKGASLTDANFSGARFMDESSERSLTEATSLQRLNLSGTTFTKPSQVCELMSKGAILISDYQRWSNAGRPVQSSRYKSDADRKIELMCSTSKMQDNR
jgi:uncharacterized protein YjbI with pentapeptide repeats